ncbi:hypothetical protein CRUP_015595 [Coryphaenoides rupestris]|nr:hypothetical protein CRUP_015595 [Coryphaenoides rupestris]
MTQKVVLITGCSSGIGLALAVRIASDERKRFMVYATMRNLSRGRNLVEAAGRTLGRTLEIKQLDVCDETSIKGCSVTRAWGLMGPIECQSMEEMKAVMDTNFFGLVRLMKEVLPDMKRRKRGHVVVISSVMGIQGKQQLLSSSCVAPLVLTVPGVSVIEQARCETEFERKVYDEGVKTDLSKADEVTADMFTNVYLKNFKEIFETLGQTPEDIAETNALYTPVTSLKYADPSGELSVDTFYGAAFEHDAVFNASHGVLRLLSWPGRQSFTLDKKTPA